MRNSESCSVFYGPSRHGPWEAKCPLFPKGFPSESHPPVNSVKSVSGYKVSMRLAFLAFYFFLYLYFFFTFLAFTISITVSVARRLRRQAGSLGRQPSECRPRVSDGTRVWRLIMNMMHKHEPTFVGTRSIICLFGFSREHLGLREKQKTQSSGRWVNDTETTLYLNKHINSVVIFKFPNSYYILRQNGVRAPFFSPETARGDE